MTIPATRRVGEMSAQIARALGLPASDVDLIRRAASLHDVGKIAIPGRIVTVADVFDALTNERPYKKAWARADAIEEIMDQSGRQFDPAVVEAFFKLVEH